VQILAQGVCGLHLGRMERNIAGVALTALEDPCFHS